MCAASSQDWNIVIEVKSMSLVSLLRFARGTVTFTVKGAFAERFLNLLSRNEIPVFHTRCTPEGYTAQTTVKHYRRIRPFVRKTHVRVRVVQRNGLPFWVQRYRRRVGLLVGIGLFCLCVGLSGQFVWSIELNGNQTVSDDAILQSLEEMGLHRGSWKKSLDVQKMAIRLRQEYHQVGWAAVNLVGSVAEVEISERNEGEEEVQDTEPCNIVAARGGQIVQMEVYDGEGLRKKGETVKKREPSGQRRGFQQKGQDHPAARQRKGGGRIWDEQNGVNPDGADCAGAGGGGEKLPLPQPVWQALPALFIRRQFFIPKGGAL